MSKRKGDYITIEDLINEVGKDATRFIMLNRSSDVELDFDFDNVVEKSKDNPLYYCLLYTSPSPRDGLLSRMPSSA